MYRDIIHCKNATQGISKIRRGRASNEEAQPIFHIIIITLYFVFEILMNGQVLSRLRSGPVDSFLSEAKDELASSPLILLLTSSLHCVKTSFICCSSGKCKFGQK